MDKFDETDQNPIDVQDPTEVFDEANVQNEAGAPGARSFFANPRSLALCIFALVLVLELVLSAFLRGAPWLPQAVSEALAAQTEPEDLITPDTTPNITDVETPGVEAPGVEAPGVEVPVFTPTEVIIDDISYGVLASYEAANTLINDILAHYEAMIEQTGEIQSEYINEIELKSAAENAEITTTDELFSLLVAGDTPLTLITTITESSISTTDYKTVSEDDAYLIEGTRIVVAYGKTGETQTLTTHTFNNGLRSGAPEEETIILSEMRNGLIRIGTQKADPDKTPNSRQGKTGPSAGTLKFKRPTKGSTLSYFGQRNGILHLGIDYEGDIGDAVNASCDGTVVSVIERGGYGLMIEIDHGGGFVTRYAHLDSAIVKLGDGVVQGQQIGMLGDSGNCDTPHLHFELRINGEAYNPRQYI